MHGAPRIQSVDRPALQCRRYRGGMRDNGDADIGFEQLDQVALRRDFVFAIDVEPVLAQGIVDPFGVFSIAARQQLFAAQIPELDTVLVRQ